MISKSPSDATTAPTNILYQCQQCTNCCRWPGFVALAPGEAERIAAFLKIDLVEFINHHTELLPNRKGLGILVRPNHECSFLIGRDCAIQPVKPKQCVEFPNGWNFPGWREKCHAMPIVRKENV
jgi:uncharacterized protein